MQHNLINPYIVALNTEMFRDSPPLKYLNESKNSEVLPDYIENILTQCAEHNAFKALKLRAAIIRERDTVQSAPTLSPEERASDETRQSIQKLARQLANMAASLPNNGPWNIYFNMCRKQVSNYVLGQEYSRARSRMHAARLAAEDAAYEMGL